MQPCNYQGRDGWPLCAWTMSGPTTADPVVLLHGGGPDHRSMEPLGQCLADDRVVVLPDIRGYGRSICPDPTRHTWKQYADDVIALLDCVGAKAAHLVGAGIGTTIALRAALAYPARVRTLALISVEDIEDDSKKEAEIAFMDAFAERAARDGLAAAWEPVLPDLAPIIGVLVREAMPRSNQASIAAAAAIGRDRSFRSLDELTDIEVPTLVFSGMDPRHPPSLAVALARLLPRGKLASVNLSTDLSDAEDFGRAFGPPIRDFLAEP